MIQNLFLRFRGLLHRHQLNADLEAELAHHLAMKQRALAEDGMAPAEAAFAGRRAFGNTTAWQENVRDLWRFRYAESLWSDLAYAVRRLCKDKGFTLVAVLSLALGIGANTAIFSLINALMLRTLPIHDPGRLVELLFKAPAQDHFNAFDWRNYQHYWENNHVFSGLIAASDTPFAIHGDGLEPEIIRGGFVSTNYFSTLGVNPVLGRLIGVLLG